MWNLEQYRDIFGKPNTGVHSYRIFDIAVVDVALTVVVAYLIARRTDTSFVNTTVVLFGVGIALHYVFGVQTTLNKWLTTNGFVGSCSSVGRAHDC